MTEENEDHSYKIRPHVVKQIYEVLFNTLYDLEENVRMEPTIAEVTMALIDIIHTLRDDVKARERSPFYA